MDIGQGPRIQLLQEILPRETRQPVSPFTPFPESNTALVVSRSWKLDSQDQNDQKERKHSLISYPEHFDIRSQTKSIVSKSEHVMVGRERIRFQNLRHNRQHQGFVGGLFLLT